MIKPLVSIIIPVFNTGQYLNKCLNSIIEQSYSNLEIILIDDGSTDNSLDIINGFAIKDKRIVYIEQENKGLSAVRQLGLEIATGKYICNIDSDDFLHREFVEKLLNRITETNSDIAVCEFYVTKDYINYKHKCFSRKVNDEIEIFYNIQRDSFLKDIDDYFMYDSWNKMYRREFILSKKLRFKMNKGKNGTDTLFNLALLLFNPKISIVREPLYYYLIRNDSQVRKKNKNIQESYHIIINEITNIVIKKDLYNLLGPSIYSLFLAFERDSLQDLLIESDQKICSFSTKLSNNHKNAVKFIKDSRLEYYKKKLSFGLKIFNFIFVRKLKMLMYLYLKLRVFKIRRDNH